MNKFLISTPGRTASSSLFNYIKNSLKETSENVAAIDRGQYSSKEWEDFNNAEYAAFTNFNPYQMPNILKTINPKDWCLIVLSRNDLSSWLLSINALNATNEWHPGKSYTATNLTFEKDAVLSSYWYYKSWQRLIADRADEFGFGKVIRIDFNEIISSWSSVGKKINNWTWEYDSSKMMMGMTTSWSAVKNVDEVIEWVPENILD
jgi:hypothetical protein